MKVYMNKTTGNLFISNGSIDLFEQDTIKFLFGVKVSKAGGSTRVVEADTFKSNYKLIGRL